MMLKDATLREARFSKPAIGACPSSDCRHLSPQAGRRGDSRNLSVPTSLLQGTSPRPVFTGRG